VERLNDLNDLELETCIREIHKWNDHIDRQTRDGLEGALFLSLMQIETAAKKAQERLNRIRRDRVNMEQRIRHLYGEQMGT
jgi:hypothetical protein